MVATDSQKNTVYVLAKQVSMLVFVAIISIKSRIYSLQRGYEIKAVQPTFFVLALNILGVIIGKFQFRI